MGCPSRKALMSQRATLARLSSRRKYYAYSTLKAPDKGEVGGSSPPRPAIQDFVCFPVLCKLHKHFEYSSFQFICDWCKNSKSLR
jgi:hypothetical protein